MSYYIPEVDVSALTPSLHQLSNEELKQLLNDDSYERLDQMIKDMPLIKSLEAERDALIEANKTAAQQNLSRQPIYQQKRQALIDEHNELKQLKEDIDKKKSRLSEVSRQTSLETRLALMQTSTAEAEEQSETVANDFLNSELTIDSFIKDFIEKRKLANLRRIKSEKLEECIRHDASNRYNNGPNSMASAQFAPVRPAPAPPTLPFAAPLPNPAIGQNFAPYPTYGPSMPQPMPQPMYPYNAYR